MSESKLTTDHQEIKEWIDHRKGRPAMVRDTADRRGSAVLRVDFQEPDPGLEAISWDRFFKIFDKNNLTFLSQERTAEGKLSRFHKFVDR